MREHFTGGRSMARRTGFDEPPIEDPVRLANALRTQMNKEFEFARRAVITPATNVISTPLVRIGSGTIETHVSDRSNPPLHVRK